MPVNTITADFWREQYESALHWSEPFRPFTARLRLSMHPLRIIIVVGVASENSTFVKRWSRDTAVISPHEYIDR
jgi:hypothetical protein